MARQQSNTELLRLLRTVVERGQMWSPSEQSSQYEKERIHVVDSRQNLSVAHERKMENFETRGVSTVADRRETDQAMNRVLQ